MTRLRPTYVRLLQLATALCLASASAAPVGPAARADYPPLCVEITAEHPLLIFRDPGRESPGAEDYAQHVVRAWEELPEDLKPFAAMQVEVRGVDVASRHQRFRALLTRLQEYNVPTVIRLADADLAGVYPLDRAEELVREFTCIKGLEAVALPFEEYYEFGSTDPLGAPPVVRWLAEAIDLAARYGRFAAIELDQIRWPRVMSNVWCGPLYEKMRACRGYVVPIASCRGAHTVPQTAALLGLWLEGAVDQWGVAPHSAWYSDARFIEPGLFGTSDSPSPMPSPLYRAMILNGAMAGAAVYSFGADADLWFGLARHHWDAAIYPTLSKIIERGLISRQDFVRRRTKVAYHLAPSRTAEDFHLNLRDIDGVLDKGFLIRGAYGMERPGQIPELILNTGRRFWVPILSAYAPQEALGGFDAVVEPGMQTSAEAWTELLNSHYRPDGEGAAFIARVGRGTFIMNTCENRYETQSFRVPRLPAPVRQVEARRRETGVVLSWPFREGNLSYKVYKRVFPETDFTLLAHSIPDLQYLDQTAGTNETISYGVTALTDDQEPYEGAVGYGEYLALSNVESRIAEEVIVSPMLGVAQSRPIEATPRSAPHGYPDWPSYTGVDDLHLPVAEAIVKRIESWDRAFSQEDLDGVLDLYVSDYQDPQGWGFQYVRRAYQWFFERNNACVMHRQIRRWDFSAYVTGRQVALLLYCRFAGYAVTDASGRFADVPAHFPRTGNGEVWIHFVEQDGTWRIARTNPAVPNFKDILSFSASPYDPLSPGPDY